MVPHRKADFKRFKAIGNVVGESGLDLLCKILCFNPYQRITAEDALKHRFFDDVRNEIQETEY